MGRPVATLLFDAIERNDGAAVAQLLANGADPDVAQTAWPGWRPLHAAIEVIDVDGGSPALVQQLIDAGANVNARDALNDATPLLMAVFRGQHEMAACLLTAGADPTVVGSEGDTALRWAAAEGDLDMARILLGYPAARTTLDLAGGAEGCTPLGAAAHRGLVAMIELLLEAGADPATTDVDGYTALERLAQAEAEVGDIPEDFVSARAALTRARARATHAEPRGEAEVVDPDPGGE